MGNGNQKLKSSVSHHHCIEASCLSVFLFLVEFHLLWLDIGAVLTSVKCRTGVCIFSMWGVISQRNAVERNGLYHRVPSRQKCISEILLSVKTLLSYCLWKPELCLPVQWLQSKLGSLFSLTFPTVTVSHRKPIILVYFLYHAITLHNISKIKDHVLRSLPSKLNQLYNNSGHTVSR